MLINNSILNKFKDTISEKEYQSAWSKLEDYQTQSNLIKLKNETEFQSEFLSKVFDNILGYKSSANHSLKETNLMVEHKNPTNGEKTDGVIVDKNGDVSIIIELKSVKDTTGVGLVKKIRSKTEGKTPLQQAALYLFQFPNADLAVVSNFDTVIVFDRKEKFRQEFSLFDMNYETFKEFYLILNSESYWSGLTKMMIKQSTEQEKDIDDEFFLKVKTLHKMLSNAIKNTDDRDDLFNKFLALVILEDSSVLPAKLVASIHNKKDDFTHKHNYWSMWTEFFKSMKMHKPGKELMGINPSVAQLDVWQDVSYLGRVKVPKTVLDLVVEISKYDLFSMPLQKLFYTIAVNLDSPYDEVLVDNPFEFYKELLQDNDRVGCDQAASFVKLQTFDNTQPLVKLYNQISPKPIVEVKDGINFAIAQKSGMADYWIIQNLVDLDEEDTVEFIKHKATSVQLYETPLEPNVSFILINLNTNNLTSNSIEDFPLLIIIGDKTKELDRKEIKNRIILLSSEDEKWLRDHNKNSKPLSDYVEIVSEKEADLRCDLYAKSFLRFDEELKNWEMNDDFDFGTEKYLYLKMKTPDIYYILKSSIFCRVMDLLDHDETNFLDLPIFEELTTENWLKNASEYNKLKTVIRLYEFKLEKATSKGKTIDVMKFEEILDDLYDQQKDYLMQTNLDS